MNTLNKETKAEFQKLKDAYNQTGCLVRARRKTNLTTAQLTELKAAGLVKGEKIIDFGSHKTRVYFKITSIAA
jgi:hypothetical protein